MSKNFFCKLGLHNWKIINVLYDDCDWVGDNPLAKDKICMWCGKRHEGIRLYNEKQAQKEYLEQLTKEMWNKGE